MNNIEDLNYCKSGKYNYTTLKCLLCNEEREIYKPDLNKLKNGCGECNENIFNQIYKTLEFIPSKNHLYYYSRYKAFIRRCYDRNQKYYINYGARGIKVSSDWKGNNNYNLDVSCDGYKNWLNWAFSFGNIENLTIERKDNNKMYSADNCIMLPLELQSKNKRLFRNNLSKKSVIYEGVCYNGNHLMVFYWDKKLNKSITILNKNSLQNINEAADLYDDYLIKKNLEPVNYYLKKTVNVFNYLFQEQDLLNTSINSNWKQEGLSFDLYTQVESIEGIQSFNFKHWKKDKNDFSNAEMEFTDIMFFVISSALKFDLCFEHFAYLYNTGYKNNAHVKKDVNSLIKIFQDICFYSLSNNLNNVIICLGFLAATLDIDIDKLYSKYISKKCLNIFRQDNGYKEGTYIKQWPSPLILNSTIEDNVYLEMFLSEAESQNVLKNNPENFFNYLYNRLKENYPG
jgi:hypothetical protein